MELLVARKTTVITDGRRRHLKIRKGTVVNADDPIVRGREGLFEPLTVKYLGRPTPRATETATADPGEMREVRLPSKLGGEEVAPAETSGAEGRAGSTPAGTASSPSYPFDPAEHTVAQVNEYLAGAGLRERERILQEEAEGQGRRGILSGPYADLTGA